MDHQPRVHFKCKNCGWSVSISARWQDLRPTYCGNAKCDYSAKKAGKTKKSFRKDPDALIVKKPQTKKKTVEKKSTEKKSSDFTSKKKQKESKKYDKGYESGQEGQVSESKTSYETSPKAD